MSCCDDDTAVQFRKPLIIMEGFLVKQGAVIKSWKRRYFRLYPDMATLTYSDQSDGGKVLGTLDLKQVDHVRKADHGDAPRSHVILVITKGRTYKLQAADEDTRAAWIAAISAASPRIAARTFSLEALLAAETEARPEEITCMNLNDKEQFPSWTHCQSMRNGHTHPGTVRIFLSSTFRDFHQERDLLQRQAAPKLRALGARYGVDPVLLDMRWGISSEESAQNQTISRCLDAIDSSDLFIGFLGSRYGWHMTDNSTDKLLASTFNSASVLHPWLAEYRTSSVTELEFLYGALFYPTQRKENSLILLRSTDYQPPSDCDPADFGSESDYAQKKIVALRQACQDRLSTMEYMEPHEVVDHVVRTVEQYLQRRFGSEDSGVSHLQGFCNKKLAGYSVVPEANTAVELVHSVIGDAQRFETAPSVHRANSISRASVGRLPSRLDEAPVEELPPLGAGKLLIVSGTPGSGKAALLCHVARALSKESSPPVVAQEFVGRESSEGRVILSSIFAQLKEQIPDFRDVKLDETSLHSNFSGLLRAAGELSERGVVVTISGIDHLNTVGSDHVDWRTLSWIPEIIPPGVVLCVSANHGEVLSALLARPEDQLHHITMGELSDRQVQDMVKTMLRYHAKNLGPAHFERITSAPQAKLPLFAKVLVEELVAVAFFDKFDAILDQYLDATNVTELFSKVLCRWEEDCDAASQVQDALSLLWASRQGLEDAELRALSHITEEKWQALWFAAREMIHSTSGRLSLQQPALRSAIYDRYIHTNEQARALHNRIATFFESKDQHATSFRVAFELPWQLQRAGDTVRLQQCLLRLDILEHLATRERDYELIGYWRHLDKIHQVGEEYVKAILPLVGTSTDQQALAKQLNDLGILTWRLRQIQPSKKLYSAALQLFQQQDPYSEDTRVTTQNYAVLLSANDEFEAASEVYRDLLNQLKPDSYAAAIIKNNLGNSLQNQGPSYFDTAEQLYAEAAKTLTGHNVDDPEIARVYLNMGLIRELRGDYDAALALYEQSLSHRERLLGRSHMDVAKTLRGIGIILAHTGQIEEALGVFERVLDILEANVGQIHPEVAEVLQHTAQAEEQRRNFGEALKLYDIAVKILEQCYGVDHHTIPPVLERMAAVLLSIGQFREGIGLHCEARDMYLAAGNDIDAGRSWFNLGVLFTDMGELSLAIEHLEAAKALWSNHKDSCADKLKAVNQEIAEVAVKLTAAGKEEAATQEQ